MDFTNNVTDEELKEMMDLIEAVNLTGGRLFDFNLVPTAPGQCWHNVADKRVLTSTNATRRGRIIRVRN